nr:restriction endonuclease subunit S [uncultured Acinetobacter sp.]
MAKYQAYAEYKDSGVEWFQKIPINWNAVPLKYMCKGFVKDGPHETPKFIDSGIPFLSVDGIQNCKLIFDGCRYISQEDHERYSLKCKPVKGDILLGKAASVGKVAYVDTNIEFNVWSPLAVITPKSNNLGKFIYYCIQSGELQIQCEIFSNSNTQKNLGMNTIDNLAFPYPSEFEAIKIINFLDHETAKIDHLIEKQQQLIELLKEKRQAVISHAVTKGLDPNVPMKDSGVEWLGNVPEHWNVIAISKITNKITNGYVGPTRDILVPEGVPYVQATHIKKGKVNFDNAYFVREKWSNEHAKSILKQGDVLIVQTGAGTGDIGLVSANEEGFNCHALIILQSKQNLMIGSYLAYVLQSDYGYSTLYSIRTGGMHPHLNCGEVQFVKVPVPSCDEQEQIVKFIAKHLERYDLLIQKQEKAIQLMQERRTALISAAVTGKIDVRNWQAPTVGADTELSA